MSVLVDLAGQSTNDELSGVLIHLVANRRDENIPHETSFHYHEWKEKNRNCPSCLLVILLTPSIFKIIFNYQILLSIIPV
jgi:hypothetical protein